MSQESERNFDNEEGKDYSLTRRSTLAGLSLGALTIMGSGVSAAQKGPGSRPWNQDVDAQCHDLLNLGALSTEAGDVKIQDFTGENLSVDSDGVLNALHGTSFYTTFEPGTPIEEINAALQEPGTYIFKEGEYLLQDTIEIGADSVTIITVEGSHIRLADDASPAQIADNGERYEYATLINGKNKNDFTFIHQGILNPNNENFFPSTAVLLRSCDRAKLYGVGGIVEDANDTFFVVDSTNVETFGLRSRNPNAGTLVLEGVTNSIILNTATVGGSGDAEVVDINSRNNNVIVSGLWGSGVDGTVAEINESQNILVSDVIGEDVGRLVHVVPAKGAVPSSRFTQKPRVPNNNNLTIHGVHGVSEGTAIQVGGEGPARNMSLTDLNVESTDSAALRIYSSIDDQYTGLRVQGKLISSEDSGTAIEFTGGNPVEDMSLDVMVSASGDGVRLNNVSNSQGIIKASHSGGTALRVTGDSINNNFALSATNNNRGLTIEGADDAAPRNNTFSGVALTNSDMDVTIQDGTDNRINLNYNQIDGLTNGARNIFNGLGFNEGNPQSEGEWNGNGYEGVVVRDIANEGTYLYNHGKFSQIADE